MFCLLATTFFFASAAMADDLWLTLKPGEGPGKGKKIVLVSGDEEYRSEEALPQLAKILATHHGFSCVVLFAIDPKTGAINPNIRDNIPGLEQLNDADLLVLFTRFRDLPDSQMKHIVSYVNSGKPIIGMRTATHAFDIKKGATFARYGWTSKEWDGGFGRQVLGETWISHHGLHGKQSTRGVIPKSASGHAIVRGISAANGDTATTPNDPAIIWGPTDVYGVRLPLPGDSQPLVLGEVLVGMASTDKAMPGKQNNPMMPIAWTKSFQAPGGKSGKSFTTTMGASQDLKSEGTRRLLVNACYWSVGLDAQIPEKSNVDIVGRFDPTPFGFGKFRPGLHPADYQ